MKQLYEEYDADRMERGWRCLVDVYRQILESRGKVTKPRHHGLGKRHAAGLEADRSLRGGQAFAERRKEMADMWLYNNDYELDEETDEEDHELEG